MVVNQKALRFDVAQILVFICMVYILGGLLRALGFSDGAVVDTICILAVIGSVLVNHYLRKFPAKHWAENHLVMVLIFGYVLIHIGSLYWTGLTLLLANSRSMFDSNFLLKRLLSISLLFLFVFSCKKVLKEFSTPDGEEIDEPTGEKEKS